MNLSPVAETENEPSAKLPVGAAEATAAGLLATIGVVCQLGWKQMAVSPGLLYAAILPATVSANSRRATQDPESPLPIVLKQFPDPRLLSRTEPPYLLQC